MRLINADAAWVKFENGAWWDIHDRRVAQDMIDSVPTVDAVHVVIAKISTTRRRLKKANMARLSPIAKKSATTSAA